MGSFLFKDISVLTEDGVYSPHMNVSVEEGRIAYVGQEVPEGSFAETYDGAGKILMPGLYNAHAHVPMTLLRGRGENLPLDRWLNESIFPFEAHITDEAAYQATLLGIAEMLRFGVTSFSDMYYNSDARAKAIIESGVKCNLGHTVLSFDSQATYEDLPAADALRHLVSEYHGAAEGRLLIDANLHAEYTSTPAVARGLVQAAQEMGLRMQVHVSETANEVQGCKERHGKTPVAYLAECGVFDVPATAAHCVWLEEGDAAVLAQKGVTVATCPASNAKLGSGVADVMAMREAGVRIALGTDGVASNNNHNMFKDLYLLALMHRADAMNPVGLDSSELIRIATKNGALSQGREDCGSMSVGSKADVVVLDASTPWMQPIEGVASGVVYSAQGSDVRLTMVDGNVLYRDGAWPTIDVERAVAETLRFRDEIRAKL